MIEERLSNLINETNQPPLKYNEIMEEFDVIFS